MLDILYKMKPSHEYLVCIDADGCMLDNMELKHKECFCPATVNVWGLQGASRYVRETAEFVNLYSRTRGINRFPAIIKTLEMAHAREELKQRGYRLPDLTPLKHWVEHTSVLSAASLEEYIARESDPHPVLSLALAWSREVDSNIARIVHNILPFPPVKDTLRAFGTFADIVVVSATPHEALRRELGDCGIDCLVNVIAGQEMGNKSKCIKAAMEGKYLPQNVLKIGDAPSDYIAASNNHVAFYPIIPGKETESWEHLLGKFMEAFQNHTFATDYGKALLKEFYAVLPELPHWQKRKK